MIWPLVPTAYLRSTEYLLYSVQG